MLKFDFEKKNEDKFCIYFTRISLLFFLINLFNPKCLFKNEFNLNMQGLLTFVSIRFWLFVSFKISQYLTRINKQTKTCNIFPDSAISRKKKSPRRLVLNNIFINLYFFQASKMARPNDFKFGTRVDKDKILNIEKISFLELTHLKVRQFHKNCCFLI